MGKKAKRIILRDKMAVKIERIICLNKLIFTVADDLEKDILAVMAYDEGKKVDNFNRKMFKYL